jgi:DTW domain-containing protein YfiP
MEGQNGKLRWPRRLDSAARCARVAGRGTRRKVACPLFDSLKRVMISTPNVSKFHLRAQHRREGMATLQAIAHGLGVIEGDLVKGQLMKLYQAKLEQTLLGRGLFSLAKSLA